MEYDLLLNNMLLNTSFESPIDRWTGLFIHISGFFSLLLLIDFC